MAAPTWAEQSTQLRTAIKCFTDLYTIIPTIVTDVGTLEEAAEGDFLPGAIQSFTGYLRGKLSETMARGWVRGIWDAWCQEIMRLGGFPENVYEDPVGAYARLHRYMHENSKTFNDRDWTRGSMTAGGSNVGTGVPGRLTVDWEAYNLQFGDVETTTFECVRDQSMGVLKGAEEFEVRGEDASKDLLDVQGSGMRGSRIFVMHAGSGEGGSRLQNASFAASFSGTGTDKIPGWTISGTAANITQDTSSPYNTPPGVTTAASLLFAVDAGTNIVSQALTVQNIDVLSERTPWMFMVAYQCQNAGCTGTLTLTMGSKTKALTIGGVGDTSWHVLQFSYDKNLYYRNWRQDAPVCSISVANLAVGTFKVSNAIFAPLTYVNGTWVWFPGGATAFLQRDVFTAANTGPTAAGSEVMFAANWARLPMSLPTATAAGESEADL